VQDPEEARVGVQVGGPAAEAAEQEKGEGEQAVVPEQVSADLQESVVSRVENG